MMMTAMILTQIANVLAWAVRLAWWGLQFAGVAIGLWALVDSMMRPANHFTYAYKRTKGFWMALNAAGLLATGFLGSASFLGLIGMVANAVYLADVRPALEVYRPAWVRSSLRFTRAGNPRRGGGLGRGSGFGGSRGGR